METSYDPVVMGVVMGIFTTVWFAALSWAGMHEDETPRGHTARSDLGEPWWTREGFGGAHASQAAARVAAVRVVADSARDEERARAA